MRLRSLPLHELLGRVHRAQDEHHAKNVRIKALEDDLTHLAHETAAQVDFGFCDVAIILYYQSKHMVCACLQVSVVSSGNFEQIYYALLKVMGCLYFDQQCIALRCFGFFYNGCNVLSA